VCDVHGSFAALQRAKQNVETQFAVVGVTERFEESLQVMEWMLPQFFAGAFEHWQNEPNPSAAHFGRLMSDFPFPGGLAAFRECILALASCEKAGMAPTFTSIP